MMIEGVTLTNILFRSFRIFLDFVVCFYFASDWMYVFGAIWYLSKYHLDLQADVFINQLEQYITELELRDIHVIYLNHLYNKLVVRIKQFDQLSKDLISTSRLVMSYATCFVIVATTQQDNLALQYVHSCSALIIYMVFLSFLSTACSLSIRRSKVYFLANQLFIKASKQRNIRQLFILRKLIKSLGSTTRSTICLTDQSGEEMEPMGFVEFVGNTFCNFTLAVGVFQTYL